MATVRPSRVSRNPQNTPAALGYRMPAEWEPHAATWIAWPHNRSDWPGKFPPIPWVYAEIVRHLAQVERVEIIVNNRAAEQRAREILHRTGVLQKGAAAPGCPIRFHRWPTNRVWTRDYGPLFLRSTSSQGTAAVNFRFNAWAKYSDWRLDSAAGARIAAFTRVRTWQPQAKISGRTQPFVLEGGSIEVNGRGTLITTRECLLSNEQQRNPGMQQADLENVFAAYLGIKKVIWLERGIAGDDTHGHVDDMARFVAPKTVVAAVERNPEDENYAPLQENLEILKSATDQDGRPLRVLELPMPAPVIFRARRLPASYANFYIANGLVLVPTFNDPNDRVALNLLAEAFPHRRVVGIYCGDLIWGLGALHCMTQQQPA